MVITLSFRVSSSEGGPGPTALRSLTCKTGTVGACTLTRDLKKTRASIVFTVLGLSRASYVYVPASDHDPDGDSNGTKITVTRP
jgi:hypothetical protein